VATNGVAAGSQAAVTGTGLTSTAAWEVAVPSQDVLRVTTTTARSAVELEIQSRSNNASVTVTSTGAVELLTATQLAAATTTTATGTQSATFTTDATGKIKFYAYSTSTTAGTITVVESGATPASNTYFIKGVTGAENAYKLTVTAPTVAGLGSKVEYTATVVDMFGNALTTPTVNQAILGGDSTGISAATMAYDATDKVYEGSFTNRTTAGATALLVSLNNPAGNVKALGDRVTSVFVNVNGTDLQAAITALQAEVAALKADYNALANKWNKRVANKKAPKKAVTLK
jgi:hypothetical protein